MNQVPDEILLKIFKNLQQKDLLQACKVSKVFSRVSRDPSLWKEIILTKTTNLSQSRHTNTEIVFKMVKMNPGLSTLIIDRFTSREICTETIVMEAVAGDGMRLEQLGLEVEGGLSLALLSQLARSRAHRTLTALNIGISSIETGLCHIAAFQNLKKLHFRIESHTGRSYIFGTWEQESVYVDSILDLDNLKELVVEGVLRGFQRFTIGIKNGKLRNLEKLALRFLLDISAEDIKTIVTSLRQLRYLEIDTTHDLLDEIKETLEGLGGLYPYILFTDLPRLNIPRKKVINI